MTRLLHALLDAFVPTSCVGCKATGSLLCFECREALPISPRRVVRSSQTGWAACELEPISASIVIAYKDQGRTALLAWLANQMVSAYRAFQDGTGTSDLMVVAAPSSASGYQRRGYYSSELLAAAFARRMNLPFGAKAIKLLSKTTDQRLLGARDRARNLENSMLARSGLGRVLLIDDVVTSGATIVEATRALESAGNEVVGFVCFAETPSPRP